MKAKIEKRKEVKNYLTERYNYSNLQNVGDFYYGETHGGGVLEDEVIRTKEDTGAEKLSLFVPWQNTRKGTWGATFCGTKEQASALKEAFGGGLLWGGIGWTTGDATSEEKISFEQVLEVIF